jgi:hypothetical protein
MGHRLVELFYGPALRGYGPALRDSNEWRGWVCSCRTQGSGYRFADTIECVNEWGEHLLASTQKGEEGQR